MVVLVVSVIVGALIAVLYYQVKIDQASTNDQRARIRSNAGIIVLVSTLIGAAMALFLQYMFCETKVAACPPQPPCDKPVVSEGDVKKARDSVAFLTKYNKMIRNIPQPTLSQTMCADSPEVLVIESCSTCPVPKPASEAPKPPAAAPMPPPPAPAAPAAPVQAAPAPDAPAAPVAFPIQPIMPRVLKVQALPVQ